MNPPVLRCADAIVFHQPEGILGSELGAEEKVEVVLLIAVQSLCNSLCRDGTMSAFCCSVGLARHADGAVKSECNGFAPDCAQNNPSVSGGIRNSVHGRIRQHHQETRFVS